MNQYSHSKQGISGIVTTLMIVLLAIGVAAILFVVLRGIVDKGTSDINLKTKCLDTAISITQASCTGSTCSVTLTRDLGDDEIGGIDVVFENKDSTQSSAPIEIQGNLAKLQLKTLEGEDTSLADPGKIRAQVFYLNNNGAKASCTAVAEYTIN